MKSYIKSIGTAVPQHKNAQLHIAEFMADAVNMDEEEKRKLLTLYRASGIGHRHSVLPDFGLKNGAYTFFPNTPDLEPFPSVGKRMELYKKEALPLAFNAINDCFQSLPKESTTNITHLITVSCTGMYAPGLDIELVSKLNLSSSIKRTNITFMGCYAAFNALKLANTICKAEKDARVLVVCVELCTIHYQKSSNPDLLLSNALFGDGAAAALVDNTPPVDHAGLTLEEFHCDLATEGKSEMAWEINDLGFEMTLSSYVPELVKNGIEKLTSNLLDKVSISKDEIDILAIHPGGKKILEVIEEVLAIEKNKNKFAYHVLREYGNMSSPTVLFVLKEIIKDNPEAHHLNNILSFAFGPGLTLESMLLKVYAPILETKKTAQQKLAAAQ